MSSGRAVGRVAAGGLALLVLGVVAFLALLPAKEPVPSPVSRVPPVAPRTVEPATLPDYAATVPLKGTLRSVGSDTMNEEMTRWAEGFMKAHPGVRFEIEGKGSATAVPSLILGKSELGPMSRPMKPKEIDDFQAQFGHAPTGLPTSLAMVAIYVHRDNPIAGLDLQQVDAIFSSTRKGGAPKEIVRWGELGLAGEWADRPISLHGRNPASSTYGQFKQDALHGGEFNGSVKALPGSAGVVQAVAGDRYAMGYALHGYGTTGVRAVPLAKKAGEAFREANIANAQSGAYPLVKHLVLYVNLAPGKVPDPVMSEFLDYVFSRQGQEDVARSGLEPLSVPFALEQRAKVGLR